MYWITFVGPTSNSTTTLYQDYTWAIDVLAANALAVSCSLCVAPSASSPHPGVLDVVEVGGPPIGGVDPSYDYDTVGDEPIANVFETLVNYNGTAVGANAQSYVPAAATCVPTGSECTTLYGNDQVFPNSTTGAPEYWNFVIDKNAVMYDPNTGKTEAIYPSDIVFSVSRAVAYANLPGSGYYNGWILAQSLLPNGNPAWDNGIHFPANNTPENVLGSMLINDSSYCPTAGLDANGCVTFNVWGGGHSWPNFLQLITDPLGGSIEECSYYIAISATLPGFSSSGADASCPVPSLSGLTPTSWDSAEIAGGDAYPHATPQTETVAAGSGPYYLVTANFGIGYTMKANPYYHQPVGCAGQSGCLPAPGAFAGTVNVQWMLTDEQAIADYQSGFADIAGIYASHAATELTLQQKGLISILQAPTTDIGFMMPNLEINVNGLKTIDPYSTNIAANTFANVGLREFLATSFPYATVQNTLNTVDGLSFFSTYGGYFPQYLGNIYPNGNTAVLSEFPNYNTTTNTFTDPSTNAAQKYSAAWWWSQITTPGSPVYDPQFGTGGYSSTNPLIFPLIGEIGVTTLDATFKIWIPLIEQLTHNVIQPDTFDLSFSELGANIGAPGTTALDFWVLAWAADYASPWDFAIPSFLPDGTYSGPNAYYETLTEEKYTSVDPTGTYNSVSCGHTQPTDANLSYWAFLGEIPDDCQGIAYNVTSAMIHVANANPNLALGTTEYQESDAVFCELGLTVPDGQTNAVLSHAPWVNPNSIDTNLILSGGLADIMWYDITGNGVV